MAAAAASISGGICVTEPVDGFEGEAAGAAGMTLTGFTPGMVGLYVSEYPLSGSPNVPAPIINIHAAILFSVSRFFTCTLSASLYSLDPGHR